jgi:hypothetical protein
MLRLLGLPNLTYMLWEDHLIAVGPWRPKAFS